MSGLSESERVQYLRHKQDMENAVAAGDLDGSVHHLAEMDRIMPREEIPPGKMGSSPGAMTEEEFWKEDDDDAN